jgi:hypothetical protein
MVTYARSAKELWVKRSTAVPIRFWTVIFYMNLSTDVTGLYFLKNY